MSDSRCVETFSVREITRGFAEDESLRSQYEREGFGLETVFERPEQAQARVIALREDYGLAEEDVRIVQHISSPETGCRSTWQVYVRSGKGVPVLFL